MQLCSMTSMFFMQRGTSQKTTVSESLRRHKALGFSALDLNLCAMQRHESEFNQDDWQQKACMLREEADKLGLSIIQGHLPFRSSSFRKEDAEELMALTLRALKICAVAGVKWAVVHPVHDDRFPAEALDEQIAFNQTFYQPLLELAEQQGVGLAFENLSDMGPKRRFCAFASELAALTDRLCGPKIGVCWDFGHANLTYGSAQTYGLRLIGPKLKALHFADNLGSRDDHLAPFLGQICWEEIMHTLREVNYQGPLTLEVMQHSYLPEALKDSSMGFLMDISRYLIQLYEEAGESPC